MVLDKIRQLNSLVTTVGTTQTSIIPHSLSSALPYTRTAVQSNATRTVRFNSFVLQRWRMVSVKTKARSIDFILLKETLIEVSQNAWKLKVRAFRGTYNICSTKQNHMSDNMSSDIRTSNNLNKACLNNKMYYIAKV